MEEEEGKDEILEEELDAVVGMSEEEDTFSQVGSRDIVLLFNLQ